MTQDLDIYERCAAQWWVEGPGPFRSLQRITAHRLQTISRWFEKWLGGIQGKRILDIGCGGGLLAVPLAAAGAKVTGIDLSFASLREAVARLPDSSLVLRADATRLPFAHDVFDGIVLGDVLEHIPEYGAALREAAAVLRPGGVLYVNTINRTARARLLAVVIGEGIGLIPRGTHDPTLFIRPEELRQAGRRAGLSQLEISGERPAVIQTARERAISFTETRSLAVAYSALFRKEIISDSAP